MKTSKIKAKKLYVTAEELNHPSQYTFDAFEFENGLILVPGDTTSDWFFEDRDSIEGGGSAAVIEIEEGEEVLWSPGELLASVQGSIREWGVDSVPAKHAELWRR